MRRGGRPGTPAISSVRVSASPRRRHGEAPPPLHGYPRTTEIPTDRRLGDAGRRHGDRPRNGSTGDGRRGCGVPCECAGRHSSMQHRRLVWRQRRRNCAPPASIGVRCCPGCCSFPWPALIATTAAGCADRLTIDAGQRHRIECPRRWLVSARAYSDTRIPTSIGQCSAGQIAVLMHATSARIVDLLIGGQGPARPGYRTFAHPARKASTRHGTPH